MTNNPGIAATSLIDFGQTGEYGTPNIPAWKQSAGFAPLETLPAAWFNGYMNELDTHINQLQNLTLQIQTEMTNLMSAASITPSDTNLTQIRQSIQALIKSSDSLLIADDFDADVSYSVGQYVLYNDYLYICTTAHTGAWDSSHFSVTRVGTKLTELKTALSAATAAIGDLSSLSTTAKTNLVAAINEVDSHADDNAEAIGDLNSLATADKTNLVAAINEVDAKVAPVQYSTSEFDTKKKWIDGKTIYGRVIEGMSFNTALSTSFPDYGEPRTFIVYRNTLYVGTRQHGIYTSTNGTTFTQNTSFPTNYDVYAFAIFNNTLYVGTRQHGIYTSTNGTTFTQNTSFPTNYDVYAFAIFNNTLYAGTDNYGIYTSTNGTTFTRNTSFPTNQTVYTFVVFNNTLCVGTQNPVQYAIDGGFYTSTDGTTFTQNVTDYGMDLVQALIVFNSTLYMAHSEFGTARIHGLYVAQGFVAGPASDISELLFVQLRNATGPVECSTAYIRNSNFLIFKSNGFPTQAIIEYTKTS